MNEEPKNTSIDPDLEVRVVALMLGEASDFEREQLEELIRNRPELAEFKREMEGIDRLLGEQLGSNIEGDDEQWRLSSSLRQNLLAEIGGEPSQPIETSVSLNSEFSERFTRKQLARIVAGIVAGIAAVVCVATFFGSYLMRSVPLSSAWDVDAAATFEEHAEFDSAVPMDEYSLPIPAEGIEFSQDDDLRMLADKVPNEIAREEMSAEYAAPRFAKGLANQSRESLDGIQESLQFATDEPSPAGKFAGSEIAGSEIAGSESPADGFIESGRRGQASHFFRRFGSDGEQIPWGVSGQITQAPMDFGVEVPAEQKTSRLLVPDQSNLSAPKSDSLYDTNEQIPNSRIGGVQLSDNARWRTRNVIPNTQNFDAPVSGLPSLRESNSEASSVDGSSANGSGAEDSSANGSRSTRSDPSLLGRSQTWFGDGHLDAKSQSRFDSGVQDFESKMDSDDDGIASQPVGGGGYGGRAYAGKRLSGIDATEADSFGEAGRRGLGLEQEVEHWDESLARPKLKKKSADGQSAYSELQLGQDRSRNLAEREQIAQSKTIAELKQLAKLEESANGKAYLMPGNQAQKDADKSERQDSSFSGVVTRGLSSEKVREFYSVDPSGLAELQEASKAKGVEKFLKKRSIAGFKPEANLGEILASKQAFSTFSLHVGDVSFKLARTALEGGNWPDPSKIRIEEFVNAFDYGDPMPRQPDRVACRVEQGIHPFQQQRNLLRISMRTAAAGRASSTPLRLTLLVDSSGSMERIDRRQTLRQAVSLLASQLRPNDRVSLISFARQPRLLLENVSPNQAQRLVAAVDNLPSEGGTNIESAVKLAFEKSLEHRLEGAQNRVIIMTDGAVNLGNADPEKLTEMVETMRGAGIAFDAAGISPDGLNDEVLEALTRKGDGRYYVLDSREAIDEVFVRQIAGALRPSAKNVKVQVEFNPKRVARYALLGFEKHRLNKEDFRNDQVDAAEMAAAEAGVAMYQFEVKPEGEGDVGTVSVRFQDLSTGQMIENRWPLPYESNPPRLESSSWSLRLAASSALFASKLAGHPIGDSVNLRTLSALVSDLKNRMPENARVRQLDSMLLNARQLSEQK